MDVFFKLLIVIVLIISTYIMTLLSKKRVRVSIIFALTLSAVVIITTMWLMLQSNALYSASLDVIKGKLEMIKGK